MLVRGRWVERKREEKRLRRRQVVRELEINVRERKYANKHFGKRKGVGDRI